MQLDIGTSMRRYAPPIGTAGLARCFVRGYRRVPAPPPRMTASTDEEGERKAIGAAPPDAAGRSTTARVTTDAGLLFLRL